MWINFYRVSQDARNDFIELCPSAVKKVWKEIETTGESFNSRINRKIRKGANLGKVIEVHEDVTYIQYYTRIFAIKNFEVVCITDTAEKPFCVSKARKEKYNMIEAKLSVNRAERKARLPEPVQIIQVPTFASFMKIVESIKDKVAIKLNIV